MASKKSNAANTCHLAMESPGWGYIGERFVAQKAFWATNLSPMYPHPGDSIAKWQVFAALLFLLAITALVTAEWRHRYLPMGWLWFVGTLVPMIGLVQVGTQAMADR